MRPHAERSALRGGGLQSSIHRIRGRYVNVHVVLRSAHAGGKGQAGQAKRPTYLRPLDPRTERGEGVNTWKRDLREALEHAPRDATSKAPGLIAFDGVPGVVCATCSARLCARGFGTMLRGLQPVYADMGDEYARGLRACSGCGTVPQFNSTPSKG